MECNKIHRLSVSDMFFFGKRTVQSYRKHYTNDTYRSTERHLARTVLCLSKTSGQRETRSRKIWMGWVLNATNSQTTKSPRTFSIPRPSRMKSQRPTLSCDPSTSKSPLSQVSRWNLILSGARTHLLCSYLIPDIFFSRSERASILELRAGFLCRFERIWSFGSKRPTQGSEDEINGCCFVLKINWSSMASSCHPIHLVYGLQMQI